jgi:long-chain acyl-CoA synthetase
MTRPSADANGDAPVIASTIVDVFARRIGETPHGIAFRVLTDEGRWSPVEWAEMARRVSRLAAALAARGIGRGTRVALCARTSIDWEVAQMAALHTGASVVGLDPGYPDSLLATLLGDAQAQVLIAQSADVLARFPAAALARLALVATIDETPPAGRAFVPALRDLECSAGTAIASRARREDEAVVVHSSGTTGTPKTIVYRHEQLAIALQAILDAFPDIDATSTLVCWLPLSNLFQRMINFAAMARGASSYMIEDPRAVMEHLPIARPDVFMAVPRFFEKVQAGIDARIDAGYGIGPRLAKGAIALGHRRARALNAGRRPGVVVRALWPLADRWVLARIRAAFGNRLRYFVSGSAPMPQWLLDWYDAIGLPVLEAYGVSEDIVPIAANRTAERRIGTVGRPMAAHEVKLADDGEILVRGPGVARSSLARASDGFLATGDLGEFDRDGFLRIVGRKADVFKSSTGRWIVPTEIEGRLAHVRYIDHAVVSGAGRKAAIAVVSIAASHLQRAVDDVPEGRGAGPNRLFRQLRADVVEALADLPPHQRPAGLLIVGAGALSVAGGELTTNLKVRRRRVEEKFAADIARLHQAIDRTAPSQSAGPIVVVAGDREGAEPA